MTDKNGNRTTRYAEIRSTLSGYCDDCDLDGYVRIVLSGECSAFDVIEWLKNQPQPWQGNNDTLGDVFL